MAKDEKVENWSDSAIRSKLIEYGYPVGPITETTRKILIKKLVTLMKQKKPPQPQKKKKWGLSSGESDSETEHHGVLNFSLPNSFSQRSKASTLNSTFSSSTTTRNRTSNSDASRLASPFTVPLSPRRSARGNNATPRRSTYEFDSGSDTDWRETSIGGRRTVSSRLSLPSSSQKKDSRIFSNFTRRFTRVGNEVGPQDIKETDVDEGNNCHTTPVHYRIPNRPTADPFWNWQGVRGHLQQRGPVVLLVLFFLFFLWIALSYYSGVSQLNPRRIASKPNNVYPLCTESDASSGLCIPSDEVKYTVSLLRNVREHVVSHAVQSICGPLGGGPSHSYLTEREIVQFLVRVRPLEANRIEDGVRNLALLMVVNPQWDILVLRADATEPPA